LSLAIGKRGQNVRLATKLVGWNIDIRSEEEIKKEVAAQMGALIASGGAVPLTALEGVTAATSAALAEHGIEDIDALAALDIDTLVEYLDTSLDEAQAILDAAQGVIAARELSKQTESEEGAAAGEEAATETDETAAAASGEETKTEAGDDAGDESASGEQLANAADTADTTGATNEESGAVEQHAFSAEADPNAPAAEVEPSEAMIAKGYDEAVEQGTPFHAEPDILANESADPVALSEVEEMSVDALVLQDAGRDLRPDTITPEPSMTSSEAALFAEAEAADEGEPPVEEDAPLSPSVSATEASAPEVMVSSEPAPIYREQTNDEKETGEGEQQDASRSAE
jgi:hypothetical protein